MATWVFRAVLPAGATFSGQIVYDATNINVPTKCKRYIQRVSIERPASVEIKYTGFESKVYRVRNDSENDVLALVSVDTAGDLPRDLYDNFRAMAVGCNGAGMEVQFYDDIASTKQYRGRWINAGDLVESNVIHSGVSLQLACFEVQSI